MVLSRICTMTLLETLSKQTLQSFIISGHYSPNRFLADLNPIHWLTCVKYI